MFKWSVALMSLACLGVAATAQGSLQSTGLGDVDPWGVGALSRSEGALPASLWSGSDAELLTPLMTRTSPRNTSPTTRDLMRRMVLSSARKPSGEDIQAMLNARFDLVYALGALDEHADFVRRLPGIEGPQRAREARIDREFAAGNLANACANARSGSQMTPYLLNARAVCFALEGNASQAELALEFARAEGRQDPWLITAVAAIDAPEGVSKPNARFDTGLKSALSVAGELPTAINALASANPGIAALLAERRDVSRDIRIQAADAAAVAGLIDQNAHRRAYRRDPEPVNIVTDANAVPVEDSEPVEEPQPDYVNALDEALTKAADIQIEDTEKARAIRNALLTARGDLARFSAVSAALLPDIRRIRNREAVEPNADLFALAAFAAGDFREASRQQRIMERPGRENVDSFMSAWLAGLRIVVGQDGSEASALRVSSELAKVSGEVERRAAAKMLRAFLMLDRPLSIEARVFLSRTPSALSDPGRNISEADLLLIEAALDAGAEGEGLLRVINAVGRDPSSVNMSDLGRIIRILRDAGYQDEGRALVIEGLRFQRPRS